MGCEGCPEPTGSNPVKLVRPVVAPAKVYMLPSKSTTKHPQSTLGAMLRGGPTFHPNGDIEFTKGFLVADIEGYDRDQENLSLFHPRWPGCDVRAQAAWLVADGSLEISMMCRGPEAPTFNMLVTCATCESCPFKKSGPGGSAAETT